MEPYGSLLFSQEPTDAFSPRLSKPIPLRSTVILSVNFQTGNEKTVCSKVNGVKHTPNLM